MSGWLLISIGEILVPLILITLGYRLLPRKMGHFWLKWGAVMLFPVVALIALTFGRDITQLRSLFEIILLIGGGIFIGGIFVGLLEKRT